MLTGCSISSGKVSGENGRASRRRRHTAKYPASIWTNARAAPTAHTSTIAVRGSKALAGAFVERAVDTRLGRAAVPPGFVAVAVTPNAIEGPAGRIAFASRCCHVGSEIESRG